MRFFCVVDKSYGESHSFVDGMLLGCVRAAIPDTEVVFSKPASVITEVAGSVAAPFARTGAGRILFPFYALGRFLTRHGTGRDCVVFVRNDPLTLYLFATLRRLRFFSFDLRFQSSFPHEIFSGGRPKLAVARSMLRAGLRQASVAYVVNAGAIPRLRAYAPQLDVKVIPLCTDFPLASAASIKRAIPAEPRLVYAGGFARIRRLDVLLSAIELARRRGGKFSVSFYGGDRNEFLVEYPHASELVDSLVERGFVSIRGRLSRPDIVRELDEHDVGICVLPPTDMFRESSSTKVAEYLARGLPVLMSRGIPFHDEVSGHGDVGWLADFDVESIAEAVLAICEAGARGIARMRHACVEVCEANLRYQSYLPYLLNGDAPR